MKFLAYKKGFDPDEARDEDGKWTSGGGSSGMSPEKPLSPKEQKVKDKADAKAKKEAEAKVKKEAMAAKKEAAAKLKADKAKAKEDAKVAKDKAKADARAAREKAKADKEAKAKPAKPAKAPKPPKHDYANPNHPALQSQSHGPGLDPLKTAKEIKVGVSKKSGFTQFKNHPDLVHAITDWIYSSKGGGSHVGFEEINKNPNGAAANRVVSEISKLQVHDGQTFRSISFKRPEQANAFLDKIQVGKSLPIKGALMSTSKSKEFVAGFSPRGSGENGAFSNCRVHFVINGKSGRDISHIAGAIDPRMKPQSTPEGAAPGGLDQREVVFLKGSKFKITKIDRKTSTGNGSQGIRDDNGRLVNQQGVGKQSAKFDEVSTIYLDEV